MKPRGWIHFFLFLFLFASVLSAQESPFLVGEFTVTRVVDGDTIAVEGLEETIRFLCIDTEECEKGPGAEQRTADIEENYLAYVKKQTRENPMAKFSTPLGWKGKKFAEKWFPIGSTVRIEYDSLSRKTGYYGRTLGYVFVRRDEKWINYNIECVRAGMSPYFDKYGKSERFEADFIAAEREARIHKRGIWSPYAKGYPNYDDRLVLWSRRAKTMDRFEEKHGAEDNAFSIMDEDDWAGLEEYQGKEVLLFGAPGRWNQKMSPPLLELEHKNFSVLAVSFAAADVADTAGKFLEPYPGDFLYFRGILQAGFSHGRRTYVYSLKIESSDQIFADIPGSKTFSFPPKTVKPGEGEIHWKDAPKAMGKEVTVVGRIVRTNNIGSRTFLNFNPDYRTTLSLVIQKMFYPKFPEPPEAMYKDRTIRVRGTVTEYNRSPQMIITGPEQIEIIE